MRLRIQGLGDIRTDLVVTQNFFRHSVPRILMTLAAGGVALMKDRVVEDGWDVRNQPFVPYSPGYEGRKRKRGGKNYIPGLVNLNDTGTLMASIQTKLRSPSTALAYVNNPRAAVYGLAHQLGHWPQPKREWFGLTPEEKDDLARAFQELADKELAGV